MGILSRLFGNRTKWKCTDCGKVHRSNPSECKKCGSKILQQHRD